MHVMTYGNVITRFPASNITARPVHSLLEAVLLMSADDGFSSENGPSQKALGKRRALPSASPDLLNAPTLVPNLGAPLPKKRRISSSSGSSSTCALEAVLGVTSSSKIIDVSKDKSPIEVNKKARLPQKKEQSPDVISDGENVLDPMSQSKMLLDHRAITPISLPDSLTPLPTEDDGNDDQQDDDVILVSTSSVPKPITEEWKHDVEKPLAPFYSISCPICLSNPSPMVVTRNFLILSIRV